MSERSIAIPAPAGGLSTWGYSALLGSAVLFLAVMAPRLFAEVRFGPICAGHGSLFALHCPACYGAAALAIAGVALILGKTFKAAA